MPEATGPTGALAGWAPPTGPPLPPPPRDSGPGMAAPPRRAAIGVLVAAVVGAVVLPGERLGLGVLLVALALAAVAAPRAAGRWERGWLALAVVLAAVPVVRDASWVVLPCLAGALLLGSLAVAGGRTWATVFQGALRLPRYAPAGLATSGRLARAAVPEHAPGKVVPALRGLALASGLVAVFGLLFASADEAFAQLAGETLPTAWDLSSVPGRLVAFGLVLSVAASLAIAPPATAVLGEPARRLGAGEWHFGLAALAALFAAFVAVQLTVLFGEHRLILDTAGLTYAEYAHEGFGQLLVVAALVLALAAAALRYAPPGRRLAIRTLLVVLFALTFVILASALHRLDLYDEAYGATRLRLAAQWAVLVVGALLAVVLAALGRGRFEWLPRAAVLTCAAALLGLAVANPDRLIAERNVARAEPDAPYLRSLSADARPALPPALRPAPPSDDGWSGFNVARSRARGGR